jgi:pimeloyl-ACP methyl ester carboxylesterase
LWTMRNGVTPVGIEAQCAPSATDTPFERVPAQDAVVNNGWVVVATDYAVNSTGVQPYLIGDGESRSAPDAVRAARRMPELTLDARTVAWGYSQGGQAGIFGPGYAPDVSLSGIAALAPATDIARIVATHGGDAVAAQVGAYLAEAYSQYYSDVHFDDVVGPDERAIARQIARLCYADPKGESAREDLTRQLQGRAVIDPKTGTIATRLRQNAASQVINVPVVVVQGTTDGVVDPAITDSFVDQQCAAGQTLDYWLVPGRGHGGILAADSPVSAPLVDWTKDRLASVPLSGCRRTTLG